MGDNDGDQMVLILSLREEIHKLSKRIGLKDAQLLCKDRDAQKKITDIKAGQFVTEQRLRISFRKVERELVSKVESLQKRNRAANIEIASLKRAAKNATRNPAKTPQMMRGTGLIVTTIHRSSPQTPRTRADNPSSEDEDESTVKKRIEDELDLSDSDNEED